MIEDRWKGSDTGKTVTRIGGPDPYRVEWLEKAGVSLEAREGESREARRCPGKRQRGS